MKKLTLIAAIVTFMLGGRGAVHAEPAYLANLETTYPNVVGTKLDSCTTCHNQDMTNNAFGLDFATFGYDFGAMSGVDSDGDSFSNLSEIQALTFPGDNADHPSLSPSPPPTASVDTGLPVPISKVIFPYQAHVYPLISNDPASAQPVAVGPVAEGGDSMDVQIGIDGFASPVDLYFIYRSLSDPYTLYFMNADYTVAAHPLGEVGQALDANRMPAGVAPWKTDTSGPVNEIVLNKFPASGLGTGAYEFYLLAAPSGYLDRYYLWSTVLDRGQTIIKIAQSPLIPEPGGQDLFSYTPVVYPVVNAEPSAARPISVGQIAAGGDFVSVQVGIGKFVSPMDLYFAYSLPTAPGELYFMNGDYSVSAHSLGEITQSMAGGSMPLGLEPWKRNSQGDVNEIIVNNVPASEINNGAYNYYLLATPSGSVDRFYLWNTEFLVENITENSISSMTPPGPSTDGVVLYSQNCAICHGQLSGSTKIGKSPSQIQEAINTLDFMKGLNNLSAMQISAIAGVLVPSDGAVLYGTYCASCHNALASSAKAGASATTISGAIGTTAIPAMNTVSLKGLSAAQISAIAGVLAIPDGTVLYDSLCASCHNALASSAKAGASAATLSGAIGTTAIPAMNTVSLKGLSAAQISAIAGVLATATTPTSLDGTVLYDSLCASCHSALASSAKAGASAATLSGAIGTTAIPAMNTVSLKGLSAAQISAIAGVLATATTPTSLDGAVLYGSLCASCHSALASSAKAGASAATLSGAIGTTAIPAMNTVSLKGLSAAQISAIAGVLATATTPTSLDGAVLYDSLCASCHSALASSAKAGASAATISGAIGTTAIPAMNTVSLKGLSAAQISAIATALSTIVPPAGASHPSNWLGKHGDQVERSGAGSCTSCHGANLRGGVGPSCYTCHGREW